MSDNELLEKAKQLDDEDWNGAFSLAMQANDPDMQREIERIACMYYRNEEYRNGDF